MKKFFLITLILIFPFIVKANIELVDSKNKFDLGLYNNTNYNNLGFLELNSGVMVGSYESKVFDLTRESDFIKINWTPFFPIHKELPENNGIETIYSEGNISMTNNVLLMHLNESVGETVFGDTSGNNNNGTCTGVNCPISDIGILGNSIKINGGNLSRVSIPDNLNLNPGSKAFSVCHWFKIDDALGNDEILYNKENLYEARVNNGYYNYAWRPHWAWDGGTSFKVNSNEWYHACLVYDNTKQVLYKNGVKVFQRNQTGDIGANANNLCLGARGTNDCNNSRYAGNIDEFSIWDRDLSSTEILNIYKRGLTKLNIQLKSCDDSNCLGENYSNIYEDSIVSNNTFPSINISPLDVATKNNRYFKFKINLESLDSIYSPKIKDLSFEYNFINHVPTDISLSSYTQDENTNINSNIATILTNDIDINDSFTYTLNCLNPGFDDGNFNIDNDKLRNSTIFDYETKNSYDICIKVDDGNGGVFEKNFIILINDINNLPTDINLSNININENIPSGSIISSISVIDDGEDGSYSYLLDIFGDSAKFSIQGDQLIINESPDYETQNIYNLRIKVNDGVNDFTKDFIINVNDSIENTHPIILNSNDLNIDENKNLITTIEIQDNDLPVQDFIYFVSGGDDVDKFSINSADGKLYFWEKKDFENPNDYNNDGIYEVEVSVMDNGQPRLITSKIFNVKVKDIKESLGKSGKIHRPVKIIYRDKIIYKEKACPINNFSKKEDLLISGKECVSSQILTQNLKSGDRDGKYSNWESGIIKEVKILQRHMNRLGFKSGEVDGVLGPVTYEAIKRMQKFLGTEQDGLVGPQTRALINNSCS